MVYKFFIPLMLKLNVKLCGRAGRGGRQSRVHILLITDEAKIQDPTLKSLFTDKENCFRSNLVSAVGDTVQQNSICCIACGIHQW